MDIKSIPISRIIAAPYNPRLDLAPGDPEYERLERSLDEFGCVEPLVWNRRTGHLVGGHQRLKVLIAKGETRAEVSVVDLRLEKEKALNLALNRISGDWDLDKLAAVLEELAALPEFDIEITGFGIDEARELIAGSVTPEARPESFDVEGELAADRPVVTRPGDLLVLGPHRLLCGDSTDAAQVRRLMAEADGQRAVLFATDPPYCVGYDGTNHPGSQPKPAPGGARRPSSRAPTPAGLGPRTSPRTALTRGTPTPSTPRPRSGAGRPSSTAGRKNKDWSGT